MEDQERIKQQLMNELTDARQRIAVLERSEAGRKQVENELRDREKRLLKAQRAARMGFLDYDMKTNDMYWPDEV